MKTKLLSILLLLALAFSALVPVTATRAASPVQIEDMDSKGVSPEKMLNPDGTLNLDKGFSGSLDLSGYNVQIDSQRGLVFSPAVGGKTPHAPASIATTGNWANVGEGGGSIDGAVLAIAISGTDVYVAGFFSDAGTIPAADYVAKWNGSSWSALGSDGAGNGALNSGARGIAVSGTDVYVGGDFIDLDNNGTVLTAADHIAKWDGANWSALGSNGAGDGSLNAYVDSIVVSGTDIYVGGFFTNVNNNGAVLGAADRIAKWNGSNWSALGSNGAGNGSLNGYVVALAGSGTNLYVGGAFTDVNNGGSVLAAADYVAKWNGSNWSALGSNGAGNGALNANVDALALDGSGNLYVGGWFVDVNNNGTALPGADYIAKWNGAAWSALGSNGAGDGALNGFVGAILVVGTDFYVGGGFTNVNNNGTSLPNADFIAKWNGAAWSALGNNGAGDGVIPNKSYPTILALGMQGSTLFAGGFFYDLNNDGTVLPQADHIAQWDGANWSALGTSVNGALNYGGTGAEVDAVAISGSDVYVGGWFYDVSNHGVNLPAADYIAKWDGTNWSALGSNGAGDGAIHNQIVALAVSGTDLYVGGYFTNVNNNGTILPTADYIAKWNGSDWSALGNNGAGNGALNSAVSVIAVNGTDVYAGGAFTNAANIPAADYIAKWNGAAWSALGSNGAGNGSISSGSVRALAMSGSNMYVGGAFTNVNNNGTILNAADYVAKWDGSSWSALGSNGAGNGSLNGYVYALAVSGTDLYAGGSFANVNNNGVVLNAADYVAKWNGSSWSALGSNGAGDGALNSYVYALALSGTYLYAGGAFTNVNNNGAVLNAADYVVKWNGSNWSALGSNGAGDGALNRIVYAFALMGTDLLVGGFFTDVNNNGTLLPAADYLAAYGTGISLYKVYLPLVLR